MVALAQLDVRCQSRPIGFPGNIEVELDAFVFFYFYGAPAGYRELMSDYPSFWQNFQDSIG